MTAPADNFNIRLCLAFQEDLLKIEGNSVLSPCLACANGCLIAYHPTKPVAQDQTPQYVVCLNQGILFKILFY